ncbi:GDYXXLXY domain-containing protein [Myroides pelagicus]|uniref:GDYXXLXY domain-containing protein n=1 Tax=Myroides pelagicus TaxID=270914 RepID=A0A7K1GP88_9FLAO|nr:GDYXXLXY domain-containing protein [Myroides pelagicus]MTH30598.1 hypothetical protein [Myroides pelagicus]
MRSKVYTYTIVGIFGLIVCFFLYSVWEKEKIVKQGQLVLLELAPVDPRSLMQGDYMRLNYAISQRNSAFDRTIFSGEERPDVESDIAANQQEVDQQTQSKSYQAKRGYVLLTVGQDAVGHFEYLTDKITTKQENQVYVKIFNNTSWNYNIGAESYFFQEGEAEKFEKAKYGGLRVDDKGNSVLVGMYDQQKKLIE